MTSTSTTGHYPHSYSYSYFYTYSYKRCNPTREGRVTSRSTHVAVTRPRPGARGREGRQDAPVLLLLQSRSLRFLNFIHPALGDYATLCIYFMTFGTHLVCTLSKRWLAMDVCSASDIPDFRQHATILSRSNLMTSA
jgi:hypothetical protein